MAMPITLKEISFSFMIGGFELKGEINYLEWNKKIKFLKAVGYFGSRKGAKGGHAKDAKEKKNTV